MTVSLSVFASGVVFGQGSDSGNDWLVFVFSSLLFWFFFSFFLFFLLLLLLLAGGSLHHPGLDVSFDSSLRSFFRSWSVTPIHGLSPMEWIFSVVVGRWDIL